MWSPSHGRHHVLLHHILHDAVVPWLFSVYPGSWELGDITYVLTALSSVEQKLGHKPVFLDVGANLGTFTLSVAAQGYPVIAFEAMQRNQDALYSSLRVRTRHWLTW
jgi:hypothetical protein